MPEVSNEGLVPINWRTRSRLVLASVSLRRSEIMRSVGFEFEVVAADIDEDSVTAPSPAELAVELARRKAAAVAEINPAACVVAADTVVELDGVSLGKPQSAADAMAMLSRLSGREHSVHTGVAVAVGDTIRSEVATTTVSMRDLEQGEIDAYVGSGAPMDKAGAYGIQDRPFAPVASIKGSYLSVVGLPLALLAKLLLETGEISADVAHALRHYDEEQALPANALH